MPTTEDADVREDRRFRKEFVWVAVAVVFLVIAGLVWNLSAGKPVSPNQGARAVATPTGSPTPVGASSTAAPAGVPAPRSGP